MSDSLAPLVVSRRQLVVLARWPASGRCKGRLAATIGAEPASRLQARLTVHTLSVAVAAAEQSGARLVLALAGAGSRACVRWLEQRRLPGAVMLRRQGEGSLGLRMQRQLIQAHREGAEAVVLIGADLPDLEAAELVQAFQWLEHQPLVLGPAVDGGYWLIGQRAPFSAQLMAGIPWGTERVLAVTLRQAEASGLTAQLLSLRSDLDRREDLAPWC
ncbi:MAG: TIGR04282 family arsenosugar biosynthesis glycosyltransferase [Vulcanococcus sp.]